MLYCDWSSDVCSSDPILLPDTWLLLRKMNSLFMKILTEWFGTSMSAHRILEL